MAVYDIYALSRLSSKDVQVLEGWASSTLTELTVAAAKWPSGPAPVEGSLVLATTVHEK